MPNDYFNESKETSLVFWSLVLWGACAALTPEEFAEWPPM